MKDKRQWEVSANKRVVICFHHCHCFCAQIAQFWLKLQKSWFCLFFQNSLGFEV
jgi:hypothetical protein